MPDISTDKVCYLIVKAREFDVKTDVEESDPGVNPPDSDMSEALQDYADDPTLQEIKTFVDLPGMMCSEKKDPVLSKISTETKYPEFWLKLVIRHAQDAIGIRGARGASRPRFFYVICSLSTENYQFGKY